MSKKLPKSLNLLLMAIILLGGAIAAVPAARAGPVPPATVQFTLDGLPDGLLHLAPPSANASEVIFTGASTLNFTHNGVPFKPYNIAAPPGATDLFIFWIGPVIFFACWTGPDRACLAGPPIPVPKGTTDRSVKTTDLIREFAWGTAKADGTTFIFNAVESVPVPSDANGDELVLTAATSTGVPEFPSFSYLMIVIGLSAVVLAYSKRRMQHNVA